jgi:hypothetical protein
MFRAFRNAAGNADLTVNVYNKLAALGEAETALLDRAQRDWLAKHLRVDITLHPPAIGRLFTAAGLPRTRPTAPHGAARWRNSPAARTASATGCCRKRWRPS